MDRNATLFLTKMIVKMLLPKALDVTGQHLKHYMENYNFHQPVYVLQPHWDHFSLTSINVKIRLNVMVIVHFILHHLLTLLQEAIQLLTLLQQAIQLLKLVQQHLTIPQLAW